MNSRERFLAACAGRPLERPPLWIMRQAGRYLPEYRALKEKHGFLEMVRTPELATEVSLQPVRRFAFDAVILFSDILVIPEALGQGYLFKDGGGIAMEYRLQSRADVAKLAAPAEAPGRLTYVGAALKLLKRELGGKQALLGFGGSPWTLATYMVEGGSSEDFERIKALFYGDRETFDLLLEKLALAVAGTFKMQIAAGADAIQIFDSWGGAVAGVDYEAASLRWIRMIAGELPPGFPIILFARGASAQLRAQADAGIRILSVDWSVDLAAAHAQLNLVTPPHPHPAPIALQGNLDPVLLNTTPSIVRREAERLLESMRGRHGHIFNLGHGILPGAKIECVEALASAVTGWR
jgi:uroporphyrinogen decarboxylase